MTNGQTPAKLIVIPGGQKCGTTSLFEALVRHPNVYGPRDKEPHFLALRPQTVESRWSWYRALFDDDARLWLDASTSYLCSDTAIENLKAVGADVKIIIMLRDPARRIASALSQSKRMFPAADRRSFRALLDSIEGTNGTSLREIENATLLQAINSGHVNLNRLTFHSAYLQLKGLATFVSPFDDDLWHFKYFQNSLYSERIERWQTAFPNAVKLVYFEDFCDDTGAEMTAVLQFLDIKVHDSCLESPAANPSDVPRAPTRLLVHCGRVIPTAERLARGVKQTSLRPFFYAPRPRLQEREYSRARQILSDEYDYWFQRNPRLKKLWTY